MLLATLALPAAGHETIKAGGDDGEGKYMVAVGWNQEPPYAGVLSGVMFFVTRIQDGWPISTLRGDIVDLDVEVLYLNGDGAVLDSMALASPTLVKDADNQYVTWFVPELPGIYAFRISGTIDDRSDGEVGPVTLDVTLSCGEDSPGKHDAFGCVVAAPRFPNLDAVSRSLAHSHGEEDGHSHGEDGHSHGEAGHSHGEDGHSHGEDGHSHDGHSHDGHSHDENSDS